MMPMSLHKRFVEKLREFGSSVGNCHWCRTLGWQEETFSVCDGGYSVFIGGAPRTFGMFML